MQVTDTEAVEMAYLLKEKDGILLGPSAAINIVGAVKLAK
jgi:cysteine synthase